MYESRQYTEGSRCPFDEWFNRLDAATAARIDMFVRRMEQGNFGNSKPVGGGSKRHQSADIFAAKKRWAAYRKAR